MQKGHKGWGKTSGQGREICSCLLSSKSLQLFWKFLHQTLLKMINLPYRIHDSVCFCFFIAKSFLQFCVSYRNRNYTHAKTKIMCIGIFRNKDITISLETSCNLQVFLRISGSSPLSISWLSSLYMGFNLHCQFQRHVVFSYWDTLDCIIRASSMVRVYYGF